MLYYLDTVAPASGFRIQRLSTKSKQQYKLKFINLLYVHSILKVYAYRDVTNEQANQIYFLSIR